MPDAATEARGEPRRRVLIAEDNPVNQKLAVAMLAKLGYQADVVGDGVQAVDAVTRDRYEAVLMDCEMPHMDGYRAAAEIRKWEAGSARIPIIAMTAAALKGDRERCMAAGMDDYISKPVDLKDLEDTVSKWIGDGEAAPLSPAPMVGAGTWSGSIDPNRVAELRALGSGRERSAFSEIAEVFLRDTPRRLASLRTAVLRGDADATEDAAHYVRGAAGNIGAARMKVLCGELETLSRSGNLSGASDLVDQLDAEFVGVRAALRVEMDREDLSGG